MFEFVRHCIHVAIQIFSTAAPTDSKHVSLDEIRNYDNQCFIQQQKLGMEAWQMSDRVGIYVSVGFHIVLVKAKFEYRPSDGWMKLGSLSRKLFGSREVHFLPFLLQITGDDRLLSSIADSHQR